MFLGGIEKGQWHEVNKCDNVSSYNKSPHPLKILLSSTIGLHYVSRENMNE